MHPYQKKIKQQTRENWGLREEENRIDEEERRWLNMLNHPVDKYGDYYDIDDPDDVEMRKNYEDY